MEANSFSNTRVIVFDAVTMTTIFTISGLLSIIVTDTNIKIIEPSRSGEHKIHMIGLTSTMSYIINDLDEVQRGIEYSVTTRLLNKKLN